MTSHLAMPALTPELPLPVSFYSTCSANPQPYENPTTHALHPPTPRPLAIAGEGHEVGSATKPGRPASAGPQGLRGSPFIYLYHISLSDCSKSSPSLQIPYPTPSTRPLSRGPALNFSDRTQVTGQELSRFSLVPSPCPSSLPFPLSACPPTPQPLRKRGASSSRVPLPPVLLTLGSLAFSGTWPPEPSSFPLGKLSVFASVLSAQPRNTSHKSVLRFHTTTKLLKMYPSLKFHGIHASSWPRFLPPSQLPNWTEKIRKL